MKRSGADFFVSEDLLTGADAKMKKIKPENEEAVADNTSSVLLDENLLYEVLKHADARTLGTAACVSKQWQKTTQDERLWELICTEQWANTGCGEQQLRSVVLALGGFKRLHALYIWPLAKSSKKAAATTSNWPCLPAPAVAVAVAAKTVAAARTRWGKDEMNLSLSLLSIKYFEKMNFSNRKK